ncbi:hypothetical protein Cni_G25985 [Canna indica]|uniref:C2H2-type domain-containing protein n=1 Tax=Canna indica TaxID=4628 RepID=A0AAQ3QLJ3_9LILI|nr:hypothetical protein Cni_G25985 [Canna indica]
MFSVHRLLLMLLNLIDLHVLAQDQPMGEDEQLNLEKLPKNSALRIRIKRPRVKPVGGHLHCSLGDGDRSQEDDDGTGGGGTLRRSGATRVCPECGKSFPSDKSLFGHLRCHPERDYRGANPPAPSEATTQPRRKRPQPGAISLAAVTNWPTARRGRKAATTTVAATCADPETYYAARILFLLACARPRARFDEANAADEKADDDDHDEKEAILSSCKRLKKKTKVRHLELVSQSAVGTQILGRRYQCNLCFKIFSSYHALGGHKASHNKNKNSPEEAADKNGGGGGGGTKREEDPVKAATNAEHRCKICDLSFRSGQALGGHQRRHFNGQFAARTPSSFASAQSSKSGKLANHGGAAPSSSSAQYSSELDKVARSDLFDFDLNEVPRLD